MYNWVVVSSRGGQVSEGDRFMLRFKHSFLEAYLFKRAYDGLAWWFYFDDKRILPDYGAFKLLCAMYVD